MLNKSEKIFSIIFAIILIAELFCDNIENLNSLHFLTKPLIVFSLIFFFLKQPNQLDKNTKYLTLLALIFSLLGDILLMFVTNSSHFFIVGLVAFLMAHTIYFLVFLRKKNSNKKVVFTTFFLLFYGTIILYFLKYGLGDLLVPVIIYMLVILTMVISAFLREGSVPKMSYQFVLLGAIFFITSDSLLALNKFYEPFQLADIFIMLTYGIAQYLIVLGLKKQS